jgi:hypothetical protein
MTRKKSIFAGLFVLSLVALREYAEHRHTCIAGLFGGTCYKECVDK